MSQATPHYLPLNSQSHAQHHWQASKDFHATRNRTLAPLAFDELTTAAGRFVLGFIKTAKSYQLVALLGPGYNAYVHPSDGRWLGTYIPAQLRAAPFELGHHPEDPNQPLLCIEDKALIAPDQQAHQPDSQPLFTPEGELAPKAAEVLNFLHQRLKGQLALEQIIGHLSAIPQLIEAWPLSLPTPEGPQNLSGFYRINETVLKNLSPEQLHDLNQHQGLAVAYAQLISTGHLKELSVRSEQLGPQNSSPEIDLDQVFGEASNDSFKF